MIKNIGSPDKIARIVLALLFAALIVLGEVSGTAAIILGVLAAVFVTTALMNFCPLYLVGKFTTMRAKH